MFSAFTDSILNLERAVILLAEMVEKDVVNVMMACIEGSNELADEIIRFDDEIDRLDENITWIVQEIFTHFNPQGGELRFLLSIPRVSAHLELIGDSCVEIANYLKQMDSRRLHSLDSLNLVPQFESVSGMTSGAVNALIDRSARRAWRTMAMLETSQKAFSTNISRLTNLLGNPDINANAMYLSLICNALYVMACNASDIAANVVYITHGVDVRYRRSKILDEFAAQKASKSSNQGRTTAQPL